VRYTYGQTLVYFPGLKAFSPIAPPAQYWLRIAAMGTLAPLDELATTWRIAARETSLSDHGKPASQSDFPPGIFDFAMELMETLSAACAVSIADAAETAARELEAEKANNVQQEQIDLAILARSMTEHPGCSWVIADHKILGLLSHLRENGNALRARRKWPVIMLYPGAERYMPEIAPEDALRWMRYAVQLMEARGAFTPEHKLMAAELAGLVLEEWTLFKEWTNAKILVAGNQAIKARCQEREAKEPARLAIKARNAEICKTARERRDARKSRVSTVEFLMKEYKLKQRSIDEILKAGGVYWDKTP
jgi:hypothetical protein